MRYLAILAVLVAVPAFAGAQNPADTARFRQRREEFQRHMEERIRKDLALTDDQAAKLRATHERFMGQRRDLMRRGQAIHEALRGQLQPGVAANADSVRKLLDARAQNRAAFAQLERSEDTEMAGYLSPVQRARLTLMRDRMFARGRHMRGHWQGPDGHMGPDSPDGPDGPDGPDHPHHGYGRPGVEPTD